MLASAPIVLLHGFGSAFDHGWTRHGWPDLLADMGRDVVGAELLGHGASERAYDPSRYHDAAAHLLEQLPSVPVDAIGFSAGSIALIRAACEQPERFRKLVLLGVGDRSLAPAAESVPLKLMEALVGAGSPTSADPTAMLFRRMADSGRNDRRALAAFLQGFPASLANASLAAVTSPTLFVVGDRDPAHPASGLARALHDAKVLVIPGLDHVSTPGDARVIDAALGFIAE